MLHAIARFLYWMVAHFTLRTYGVHQAFRFVEGIWLHRKSRQSEIFSGKIYFASYVHNMFLATILDKYHVKHNFPSSKISRQSLH